MSTEQDEGQEELEEQEKGSTAHYPQAGYPQGVLMPSHLVAGVPQFLTLQQPRYSNHLSTVGLQPPGGWSPTVLHPPAAMVLLSYFNYSTSITKQSLSCFSSTLLR